MRLACMQQIFHDKPFFFTMAGQYSLPLFPSIIISTPNLLLPHYPSPTFVSFSFPTSPPTIDIYVYRIKIKLHSAIPMTMFIHKLLQPRRLVPSLFRRPPADPAPPDDQGPSGPSGCRSAALKIVHAGGMMESYYMALPAATFIDRYPSFVLARPEVFWRPWDSVVRPEEILVPGEKYYVVPRRTMKKLRRRTGRRPAESSSECTASLSFNDTDRSGKICTCNNNNNVDSGAGKMIGWPMGRRREKGKGGWEGLGRRRGAGKAVAWQPELPVISESSAVYE